jgi:hypothetical protein
MSGNTTAGLVPDVGSQTTLNIIANGAIINSTILTSFEAQQVTEKIKSIGIDGVSRPRHLEEGWQGTLGYDRADAVMDTFFAAKEAARYAGVNPPVIQITETVNEQNGSISKFNYTGVTMTMSSGGNRVGNNKVEVKVDWEASRRIQVL